MVYRESWQGRGKALSQTTCSRRCAWTRYNWFRRVTTSTERQRAKWREASARRRERMRAAA